LRGLAHYRLIRLLGEGAQGGVYLALDTRLSRRVVIKLMHLEGGVSERRYLVAEARRVAQLEGPRVVQVLDVVASGDDLALVLRYVPGCSLAQLLAHRPALPPENALSLAGDVAAALAAARQQLLVHGDLGAGNVLLGADGRAVLTDFGVAVRSGGVAVGAAELAMTPEHRRGEALTQQSDFFAVGLLLYRMLYGSHPFCRDGELDRSALLRGLETVPALPEPGDDALRRGIEALLYRLLAADPEARPASTLALRSALQDLRARLPVPRTLVPVVRRLARDERPRASGLAVLPQRLLRPPLAERLWAGGRTAWREASLGARAFALGALLLVLGAPLAWLAQPGPCVALLPTRIEASPGLGRLLPPATLFESQLLAGLRRELSPVQVLSRVPGGDGQKILRSQGLRDSCVPQQRLGLALRCRDGRCDLDLRLDRRADARSAQLTVAAGSDWEALRRSLDQLLAQVLHED
jgi:hypothetical protein